eukprot:TRINITY_DN67716_c11_g9_i1.p1 TRINITY_DN67716_c11_g9~~TRINITY_DN67716_c11_g9_i1.p1  ORF type:complete len:257 (-),score=3.00 TRINITY_DN67716_c11_g9_i1:15-785(-)
MTNSILNLPQNHIWGDMERYLKVTRFSPVEDLGLEADIVASLYQHAYSKAPKRLQIPCFVHTLLLWLRSGSTKHKLETERGYVGNVRAHQIRDAYLWDSFVPLWANAPDEVLEQADLIIDGTHVRNRNLPLARVRHLEANPSTYYSYKLRKPGLSFLALYDKITAQCVWCSVCYPANCPDTYIWSTTELPDTCAQLGLLISADGGFHGPHFWKSDPDRWKIEAWNQRWKLWLAFADSSASMLTHTGVAWGKGPIGP